MPISLRVASSSSQRDESSISRQQRRASAKDLEFRVRRAEESMAAPGKCPLVPAFLMTPERMSSCRSELLLFSMTRSMTVRTLTGCLDVGSSTVRIRLWRTSLNIGMRWHEIRQPMRLSERERGWNMRDFFIPVGIVAVDRAAALVPSPPRWSRTCCA